MIMSNRSAVNIPSVISLTAVGLLYSLSGLVGACRGLACWGLSGPAGACRGLSELVGACRGLSGLVGAC